MKVAIVTGSNKGIGLAIVENLAKRLPASEWNIYLTARNEELGKQSLDSLHVKGYRHVLFHQLDITKSESRANMVKYVKATHPEGINIFIGNAGIAYKSESTAPFGEQAEVTCETNYFCTIASLKDFLPLFANEARAVLVSSMVSLMTLKKAGDDLYKQFTNPKLTLSEVDDLVKNFVSLAKKNEHEAHGWPSSAYGVSKMALTKAILILGEDLKADPRNLLITSCCPGYVDTDMTSHKGTLTVEQGSETPVFCALLSTREHMGRFFSDSKVVDWSKDNTSSIRQ